MDARVKPGHDESENDPIPPHPIRPRRRHDAPDRRRSAARAGARQGRAPGPAARRSPGFPGLARIICGQQLSTASARAIWGRLAAGLRPLPSRRACGARAPTSSAGSACRRPRSSRSRRSPHSIEKGELDLDAVAQSEADIAHQALIAMHGIGPWTADIYLLFCLGHADAWPAGDLALQESARIAFASEGAADAKGDGCARRDLAAVARRSSASALGLLSCGEAARRRGHAGET